LATKCIQYFKGISVNNQFGKKKKALVIGGGAPNSPLIAGALAAFLDQGIEFDVISASGAGVLMGLLYQAPKNYTPREALVRWAEVGVADTIYKLFPVNYKIFQKPGAEAMQYRSAMQPAATPIASNPFLDAITKSFTHNFSQTSGTWKDWMQLVQSSLSPSDLSSKSLGLCAHLPFLEQSVEFSAVANMRPAFYINAYNITQGRMQIWGKDEIQPVHVRAALSFPFLYPPTEIDGDDYIEGAALDTLNFQPFESNADGQSLHDDVDTLVVLDILGDERLIRKPRNLYDAWVRSVITPLVKISKAETRLFELEHNTDPATGQPKRRMLKVDLMQGIPDGHWPEVLEWSASNMQLLFEVGYRAGQAFCLEHAALLHSTHPEDDEAVSAC